MIYETFARIYDEVMDHELYQKWLDFSKRHFLPGTTEILELACGTGALAIAFAKEGFHVTALDFSEEMLTVASQRAAKEEAPVQFISGNMLDLSEVGTYQAITCFSDSLCYMENTQQLQQVFDEVFQALDEEGIFLFDVHSIYQIDEGFNEYSYHYQTDDFAFLWDSYPGEKEHSVEHYLSFFIPEDLTDRTKETLFARYDELHEERTYSVDRYLRMLENTGFSDVEVMADFEDQAPDDTSKRLFFVCHKSL